MLVKDINRISNDIVNEDIKQKIKKGSKTIKNSLVSASNNAFDALMRDDKVANDEDEKVKNAIANGDTKSNIFFKGITNGIIGHDTKRDRNISQTTKSDDKLDTKTDTKSQTTKSDDKLDTKTVTKSQSISDDKLDTKTQVKLEKSIFSKSIKEKRLIWKLLNVHYNDLVNKTMQQEAFEYLKLEKKLLTDEELVKILDSIYNSYSRSKSKSNVTEADKTLKNNIVTRKWKEIGSKRDKDSIVKLMRFFDLSDNQIFGAFDRINKGLTYDEIQRMGIDLSYAKSTVTKQDLLKLASTLGKFKLKQFLIKLRNSINS